MPAGNVTVMERRVLEAVIYEREPPIARIILNRVDKANTKDAQLVQEVDECLHEADRDKEIKVVILKANGKGFCGGHVARWGPDENPYPDFGNTFEDLQDIIREIPGVIDAFAAAANIARLSSFISFSHCARYCA